MRSRRDTGRVARSHGAGEGNSPDHGRFSGGRNLWLRRRTSPFRGSGAQQSGAGAKAERVEQVEHFIRRARGSLAQVETQIEVARSLGYITREKKADLLAQVSNVTRVLIELKSWPVGV